MNIRMIALLFAKDLFLSRRMISAYLAGGIVAVALSFVPNELVAFTGFILMLTAAIGLGIQLITQLVLDERKNHNLSFVMSLPVTPIDYSISKIAVVLSTYCIPWGVMFFGTVLLIYQLPSVPDGKLMTGTIIFLELFASFSLQLATAIISESMGWTIAVMVFGNVFFNLFIVGLMRNPELAESMKSETVAWSPLMLQIIGCELAVIVLSIGLTVLLQTRKRDVV